ncbi:MAG TPA: molybdopterin molybdenumtransferase MoeA [Candidatus Latescibacteria bacterium]|nr:molybdopterin molybdenumtransferase MoeA [Candidatus Latescibacterota bacterium]
MTPDQMLTPEEARSIILEHIQILGPERVSLLDADGRVLAGDILAQRDNPPYDNSAMDGYAVRHQDVAQASADAPVALAVVEDIPAGTVPQKQVGPGQSSRIMTGAPVPAGADTIVPVEDTRGEGESIEVLEVEEPGEHIRHAGEDMRAGQPILTTGTECGPGELAVLAAVQQSFVSVYRRPRIAILSTGDELVEIEETPGEGQIVNSNTTALAAFCHAHGAEPIMLPIARDDEAVIRATIISALKADFAVSSGGVSVGKYDFVKKVLDDLGAETIFWRVAMKPGKPLVFCTVDGIPYFGLPGNPVSSMISFLQFVRPAIRKASGYREADWPLPEARAQIEHPVDNDGGRRQYMRATLNYRDGLLFARTAKSQGSHMISSMIGANGFVVLEPKQQAAAGDTVTVQIVGPIF